ncbi:hypothetical protein AAP_01835 [Ascosphaera apis ARSEF 7405]|uniref:Uncharacterized protein n=1 Tax=Ascosphaera apis ARSEF 7405 TaxID=392613 RepID=A0A168AYQ3_9EURO|nr:hypothetical protein AAP_01835 [Ascosphaera apis ARSEF 7405]
MYSNYPCRKFVPSQPSVQELLLQNMVVSNLYQFGNDVETLCDGWCRLHPINAMEVRKTLNILSEPNHNIKGAGIHLSQLRRYLNGTRPLSQWCRCRHKDRQHLDLIELNDWLYRTEINPLVLENPAPTFVTKGVYEARWIETNIYDKEYTPKPTSTTKQYHEYPGLISEEHLAGDVNNSPFKPQVAAHPSPSQLVDNSPFSDRSGSQESGPAVLIYPCGMSIGLVGYMPYSCPVHGTVYRPRGRFSRGRSCIVPDHQMMTFKDPALHASSAPGLSPTRPLLPDPMPQGSITPEPMSHGSTLAPDSTRTTLPASTPPGPIAQSPATASTAPRNDSPQEPELDVSISSGPVSVSSMPLDIAPAKPIVRLPVAVGSMTKENASHEASHRDPYWYAPIPLNFMPGGSKNSGVTTGKTAVKKSVFHFKGSDRPEFGSSSNDPSKQTNGTNMKGQVRKAIIPLQSHLDARAAEFKPVMA